MELWTLTKLCIIVKLHKKQLKIIDDIKFKETVNKIFLIFLFAKIKIKTRTCPKG